MILNGLNSLLHSQLESEFIFSPKLKKEDIKMDSPEILSSSGTPNATINLDILPSEMVEKILLKSDLKTILNFCLTSKTANQYCQSENFWKKKYQLDYSDFTPLEKGDTWKERYQRESILSVQLQFGNVPISAGFNHWGFIHSSSVYMFGNNDFRQTGRHIGGNLVSPAPSLTIYQPDSSTYLSNKDKYIQDIDISSRISLSSEIVSLSSGPFFTGVVTKNGKVFMWGSNVYMLHPREGKAIFEVVGLQSRKAVKIVTGYLGYAVFMENGEIYIRDKSKGYRRIAPFSKNKIIDITLRNGVTSNIYILDQKGDVRLFTRDNDTIPVNFPEPIKQLSYGDNFWVALSKSGNVYTWGDNDEWQLGFKPFLQPAFDVIALGISKIGEYLGYQARSSKYKLNLPYPISFISAGHLAVAAVAENGKLYMWGLNKGGKIDSNNQNMNFLPTEVNLKAQVKYVSVGKSFTIAMSVDGDIIYWGDPKMNPAGGES